MDLILLFAHASSLSALLPFLLSFLPGKRSAHHLQYIRWLVLASLLADGLAFSVLHHGVNTWFIVNIFFITQFIFLYFTFRSSVKNSYLEVAFWIFLSFACVNYFFIESPTKFNFFTAYSGAILLIVVALFYLQNLVRNSANESILKLPLLWISYGVLLYYAGTLFVFLFNNYLVKYFPENHQYIWILHNLLNLTKNAFFSFALWKSYKAKM